MIYSYVKVTLPNIKKLHSAMTSGEDFSPSDFGEIIEAGRGLPSDEVKAEISNKYKMLNANGGASSSGDSAPAPKPVISEKKAWDEF